MFDRFFGKGDAPAAPAPAAPTAAPADAPAPTSAGDTATVRRIAQAPGDAAGQARLIASAAYILARAANADLVISDDETAVMEEALQRSGALDEATAVLVVEMAKLQAKTVGGTEDYVVTREFRSISTPEQRLNMARACFVIGAANGSISAEESAIANEIADEFDIEDAALAALLAEFDGPDVRGAADAAPRRRWLTRCPPDGRSGAAIGSTVLTLTVVAGCGADRRPRSGDSIVTFRVADGSMFEVLITDPADLRDGRPARRWRGRPVDPDGAIVRETGVNTGVVLVYLLRPTSASRMSSTPTARRPRKRSRTAPSRATGSAHGRRSSWAASVAMSPGTFIGYPVDRSSLRSTIRPRRPLRPRPFARWPFPLQTSPSCAGPRAPTAGRIGAANGLAARLRRAVHRPPWTNWSTSPITRRPSGRAGRRSWSRSAATT